MSCTTSALERITRGSHITYYSTLFFVTYAFKGQVHVFAGQVKIVSHSSCRTSAILKYFLSPDGILSLRTQVKKWVGIPVGSHWDPNRDPGGIYRDKNSGSQSGIPPGSRPNPDGILAGFSGIRPGYSRDPVGIHWDPSGIKTRDFAGSRRDPVGIPPQSRRDLP